MLIISFSGLGIFFLCLTAWGMDFYTALAFGSNLSLIGLGLFPLVLNVTQKVGGSLGFPMGNAVGAFHIQRDYQGNQHERN